MDRKEAKALLTQIKENFDRLEGCPGPHDFQELRSDRWRVRHYCTLCGGEVSTEARRWYERGLKHGSTG